jgi:hypothetical protein
MFVMFVYFWRVSSRSSSRADASRPTDVLWQPEKRLQLGEKLGLLADGDAVGGAVQPERKNFSLAWKTSNVIMAKHNLYFQSISLPEKIQVAVYTSTVSYYSVYDLHLNRRVNLFSVRD